MILSMRRRIKVIMVVGTAVLLTLGWVVFHEDGGSVYNGRSLCEWVDSWVDYHQPDSQNTAEWDAAIRHYGSNAIPYLLKWIQQDRPTWATKAYNHVAEKLRFLHLTARLGRNQSRAENTVEAFRVLGPRAEGALPALAGMIRAEHHPPHWLVLDSMVYIGTNALPAIFHVLRNLPPSRRSDYESYLGPRLSESTAQLAVPWLMHQALNPDTNISVSAREILKFIPDEIVQQNLSSGLTNLNSLVRLQQVQLTEALDFGTNCQKLITVLRQLLSTETNFAIRTHASNALYQINPPVLPK